MEGADFWEVARWVAVIASGVLLLAGFATGPAGWIAIINAKTITEMVAFFIGRAAYAKLWDGPLDTRWNTPYPTHLFVQGF